MYKSGNMFGASGLGIVEEKMAKISPITARHDGKK
jgi:hypothetical protein